MNKLLSFFIPKALKTISTYFGIGLLSLIIIELLPITDGTKFIFILLGLVIIFPVVSYFHISIYIPTSLEWILLTPTKKAHILLAHGLLNIFKIIMILVLALLSLLGFYTYKYGKLPTTSIDINLHPDISMIPVTLFVTWIVVISMILIFIFGILPNYLQNIQLKQSYKKKLTIKDKLKSSGLGYGATLLLAYYILDDSDTNNYLPWLVKVTFLLNLFWAGAIYSTLKSLRYYFSGMRLLLSSLLSSLLTILFLFSYAGRDISSGEIPVSDKIMSLNFLGAYSSNFEEQINSELLLSLPKMRTLVYETLVLFLERKNRKELNQQLLTSWMQKCNQRKDYNCRLAYYVQKYSTSGKASADFLYRSCPKDLGSCLILYTNKDISPISRELASRELSQRCIENSDNFETKICNSFKYLQKK